MPADLDRLRRQVMSLQEAEKAADELEAARAIIEKVLESPVSNGGWLYPELGRYYRARGEAQ